MYLPVISLTLANKGWGYSCPLYRLDGGSGGGHKIVGVPQPKSIHGFSQNFQDMFILRGA